MGLAVFDLDGTITRRDTLMPYVAGFPTSRVRKALGMLRLVGTLLLFIAGLRSRGDVKGMFIHGTLQGETRARVDQWTARFVPALLQTGVFAEALQAIARHKREGAWLVLMSASTDLYVPAIGKALGFDEVICTRVQWDGDRLDGRLSTPNLRGKQKTLCFEALKRAHPGIATAAYGNAESDLEHMYLADRPLLVNASARARRAAATLRIPYAARWS